MYDPVQFETGTYVGTKVKERTFGPIYTSETAFTPNMSSEWHYHVHPHFSHILEGGSKEVRKGGSDLQFAGTGLYYHPGVPHQNIDYQKGTRIFNIELREEFFKSLGLPQPPADLMFGQHTQLNTSGMLRIMKEHYLNDANSGIAIAQLCLELLQPYKEEEHCFPEWTEKIKTILHDHWNVPLSLPVLAEELALHPVTISKYFSKYFGCSAGEYLRKIKIEKAISLIKTGKHSLTHIAYECGFTDQAHFTKTFQRITGLLPRQYRNY